VEFGFGPNILRSMIYLLWFLKVPCTVVLERMGLGLGLGLGLGDSFSEMFACLQLSLGLGPIRIAGADPFSDPVISKAFPGM